MLSKEEYKKKTVQIFKDYLNCKINTKQARIELNKLPQVKKEIIMAKKTTKTFDWKGLVTTLHKLDANVPAAKLSAFIAEQGVVVSSRTIGAVRANLSRV